MSGWISLHRSIQDNDLWLAEPFTWAQAWIDLLLNANHKPGSFWVRRVEVKLERGQLGWSEITMSERWKWSRGKVRRYLGMLETRGMIVQQKTQLTSVITICNYDTYQETSNPESLQAVQQTEHQAVHQTDNRRYTNNNDNNDNKNISTTDVVDKAPRKTKKTDLDFSKWPEQPEQQTMADWLAMRKRIKADVTQTVINRLTTELTKAVSAGYTVDQCISECCLRNWRGFQLDWIRNAGVKPYGNQTHHNTSHAGRYENPTARLLRMAREYEPAADTTNIIEADFKAH